MSTLTAIRDAGPIEIEDSMFAFEADLEADALCINAGGFVSLYPTNVHLCGKNS